MESFSIPAAGGIIEKVVSGVTYILIQERFKEERAFDNGLIEIPAGKIRAFENIYDCLRREVKEETGLEVTEIEGECNSETYESNGYRVINYTPFSSTQNVEGLYPIMVQVFICKVEGELIESSDESQNLRWIPLDQLEELLKKKEDAFYPMHVITLKKYLETKI